MKSSASRSLSLSARSRGWRGSIWSAQGAELAYLLLHDPEFHSRVRREHLIEAGKQIRLKENIDLLYKSSRTELKATVSISTYCPQHPWK